MSDNSISIEVPNRITETNMDDLIMRQLSGKLSMDNITDVTISKSDITNIDESSLSVSSPEQRSLELVKDVEPVLNMYNEKYGTQFKFDDFKSALSWAVTGTKTDRELKRIINNELIFNASEFLIIKGVLAMCKIINYQLDNILDKELTTELSGESLTTISELWDWLEKLENVKARYAQYDIDKKIKKLVQSDKSLSTGLDDSYKKIVELLKSSLMTS